MRNLVQDASVPAEYPRSLDTSGTRAHRGVAVGLAVLGAGARAGQGAMQGAEDLVLDAAPALVVALRESGHGVECVGTRDLADAFTHIALLGAEQPDGLLQVARQHAMRMFGVIADHLRQEFPAQHGLRAVFLFSDDLQQDGPGDVLLVLLVDHDKIDVLDYQPADIGKRDVAAFRRIVEAPVRILLYDPRLAHSRPLCASAVNQSGRCTLVQSGLQPKPGVFTLEGRRFSGPRGHVGAIQPVPSPGCAVGAAPPVRAGARIQAAAGQGSAPARGADPPLRQSPAIWPVWIRPAR